MRLLLVAAAVASALVLTGCSSGATSGDRPDDSAAPPTSTSVRLVEVIAVQEGARLERCEPLDEAAAGGKVALVEVPADEALPGTSDDGAAFAGKVVSRAFEGGEQIPLTELLDSC